MNGPPLQKVRIVLTRKHMSWAYESDDGEWTLSPNRAVLSDMGIPDQITMTLRPGDRLNK